MITTPQKQAMIPSVFPRLIFSPLIKYPKRAANIGFVWNRVTRREKGMRWSVKLMRKKTVCPEMTLSRRRLYLLFGMAKKLTPLTQTMARAIVRMKMFLKTWNSATLMS